MKLLSLTNKLKFWVAGLIMAALIVTPVALVVSSSVKADSGLFETGNIVTAVNNTQRNTSWTDPVSANPGEIIEFRMLVWNTSSDQIAHDVLIHPEYQFSPTNSPQMRMVASANGQSISDTATVNVNGTQGYLLVYVEGHSRVFSPGCPDGCNADDTFHNQGDINVGDLGPGESAQILFKAGVTNPSPSSTPSPTPTASPTHTPTPTPSVTPSPTVNPSVSPTPNPTNISCAANQVVVIVNGQQQCQSQSQTSNNTNNNSSNNSSNNNNSSTSNQSVTVTVPQGAVLAANNPKVVSAASTPVTTLPKTGLPLAGWALMGMLPLGAGLKKKLGLGSQSGSEETANFIWEDREFKKE
jgi:hypothetical protein